MHKLKSREYLDKINETFGQLSDPAHEIDIDTLLGYIRVFYSSIKSIPVKAGSSPAGNTIPERDTPTADIPTTPATKDETDKPGTGERSGTDRAAEYPEPSSHTPAPPVDITEKDTSPTPETEKIPVIEQIHAPEFKTVTEEPSTPLTHEEPAEAPEKVSGGTTGEDVLKQEPEQIPEVTEPTPFEEIKTVVPSADENEIKSHQAVAHIINEPAPQLGVIQQPAAPTSHLTENANNMLSRIESQQNKPLYTATSQKHYDASDAVEAIFRDKSPTGLVDFLGLSPLDNLSKAWGLNEKMLVIKDLFDNDSNSFNDAVEMISKLSTFEEAKAYLIDHVVQKFAWNDVSRFKKASDFVVQVKRLFVK